MHLSVGVRLATLGAVGVLATGVVATAAYAASSAQSASAARMATVSTAMSQQWNADMLHDGIRADVMAALYASNDEQRTAYEVDGVQEHADEMLSHIQAAAKGAPPALQDDFAAAAAKIKTYGETAVALVAQAGTDKRAATAQLPQSSPSSRRRWEPWTTAC